MSDDYKFLETAEKYHQALADYTAGNTLTIYGTVSSTQMRTIPGPYYIGKGEYIASIGIYNSEAYQALVLNAPYFIFDVFEFDPQRIYKFKYIEKTKTIVSITETERMENLY